MAIDFTDVPTSELVTVFNECAEMLGVEPVKKFADRTTAERRTRFSLSQITPAKRPGRFKEESLPGGAKELDALKAKAMAEIKGSVRAQDAPHPAIKSITSVSGAALQAENLADPDTQAMMAMNGGIAPPPPLVTADRTPTPAVTTGPSERWRKPKRVEPAKVCYRPRPGSLQQKMYELLVGEGITVEGFCQAMADLGAKPTMLSLPMTWSNLGYLFVSQKGYGLDFDGTTIKLLVGADERDVPKKGG